MLISHASRAMLKILQARLQKYMNWKPSDVTAGFLKGRGTRDQIANIHKIIEKSKGIPEKHLPAHWKDPYAGKSWGQEEKWVTEDEMVGWHHRLNGCEFEQTHGDSEGWEAWCAAVHEIIKSFIQFSDWMTKQVISMTLHFANCYVRWSFTSQTLYL